jgi:hypothetical protein
MIFPPGPLWWLISLSDSQFLWCEETWFVIAAQVSNLCMVRTYVPPHEFPKTLTHRANPG